MLWCFVLNSHRRSPYVHTPNSHFELRDKLRVSSPATYIRLTESCNLPPFSRAPPPAPLLLRSRTFPRAARTGGAAGGTSPPCSLRGSAEVAGRAGVKQEAFVVDRTRGTTRSKACGGQNQRDHSLEACGGQNQMLLEPFPRQLSTVNFWSC